MRSVVAGSLLLAGTVAIWLACFYGGAYAFLWFVHAREGDTSECYKGECGPLGEFLDNHDLIAVLILALLAALPACAFLWRARSRFANRNP
jgi:hypothetical protein